MSDAKGFATEVIAPFKLVYDAISNLFSSGYEVISSATKNYYKDGFSSVINNPSYYLFASVIEMIILVLILYIWNPLNFSSDNPLAAAIIVIIFVIIQMSMYFFVRENSSNTKFTFSFSDTFFKIILTILTLIGTVLLFYVILIYGSSSLIFLFHNIVYFTIGLFALTILYLFLKPMLDAARESEASILKLFGQLFFYTPCLILDILEWFIYQYKITTKPIWILFGIEALLIALQILVPKLVTWLSNQQGKILLTEPVYLDKQHIIGNYQTLYGENDSRKYKYSISAWFWINPQPPNTSPAYTKFTNILEFGQKPAILYNALENTLRVTCQLHENDIATIYETNNIKYQSWNNIVVNYDAGTMDVFVNGEIVGSKPGIAPYMTFEDIVVGSFNGIQGGIANVVYRDDIMHAREIEYFYKAMKSLPVPVL